MTKYIIRETIVYLLENKNIPIIHICRVKRKNSMLEHYRIIVELIVMSIATFIANSNQNL